MLASIDTSNVLRESFIDLPSESFPNSPQTLVVKHADLVARCEQLCGLSLSVIDPLEGVFVSGIAMSLAGGRSTQLATALQSRSVYVGYEDHLDAWVYGLQVPGTNIIAGGILLLYAQQIPDSIRESLKRTGVAESVWLTWAEKHSGIRPDLAERLLQSAHDLVRHEKTSAEALRSTNSLAGQLGQVYEEVVLIQDLAQYLRPDIDPLTLAEAVMDRVRLISESTLSALCLHHGGVDDYQVSGEWGLDGTEVESLVKELLGDHPPQIIVRNRIDTSPLRLRFPTVRSLVAVPLFEGDLVPTWLVLANPEDGRELGTEEANMLKSIGGVLSAHAQVVELFRNHEEMVLSFIRSLVTTLDAKDSYTRGHSERVALVAQRIAEEMGLSREETQAIYQSGLLHDIGKIGVDDSVLQKQESLNALEFRKIAKHPEVGFTILSELKNLSHLLPGVLHHHERFDGRGYPGKLAGLAIPRMARVLAVADAFDAMGSDRPYRQGMRREEVEQVLVKGAGTQWDPEVVHAFFTARFDIYRLWARAIERQGQEVIHRPTTLDGLMPDRGDFPAASR